MDHETCDGHICTPVNHGDVAGVDVDADAVSRFGIPGATDGVQTLQSTGEASPDEQTRNLYRNRIK